MHKEAIRSWDPRLGLFLTDRQAEYRRKTVIGRRIFQTILVMFFVVPDKVVLGSGDWSWKSIKIVPSSWWFLGFSN